MSVSTEPIDFVNFNFITCSMDACFTAFDRDCDGKLNIDEFRSLCAALFRDSSGMSYDIPKEGLRDVFRVFDRNQDDFIGRDEFSACWNHWIKTIVRPVSAILVVDVQNDFISGTLNITNCTAKQNGEEVVAPINDLLDQRLFDCVVYSYDWHPSDHVSFINNVELRKLDDTSPISAENAKVFDTVIFEGKMEQRLWPSHCVQNTWGAELHKNLKVVDSATKIYKGTNPDVDSYSLFWDNQRLTDTKLNSILKQKNVTDIYVCGLAYDVCVAYTARDSLEAGYRTILLDDCSRGVNFIDIEKTKQFVKEGYGIVTDSGCVKNMVEGNDRRFELGYKLALEFQKNQG